MMRWWPTYKCLRLSTSAPSPCPPHPVPPRASSSGESTQNNAEMAIDLLVSCRPPDVSPWVFACLNDAGIVYDGRVVVDAGFRTSDGAIYAGMCAWLHATFQTVGFVAGV